MTWRNRGLQGTSFDASAPIFLPPGLLDFVVGATRVATRVAIGKGEAPKKRKTSEA